MRIFTLVLFAALLAGRLPAADIRPLDLSSGANSAFADETADDRRGGWTDQGANDLRLLKSGVQTLGGVPFSILDDGRSGGKSCIVLAAAENGTTCRSRRGSNFPSRSPAGSFICCMPGPG